MGLRLAASTLLAAALLLAQSRRESVTYTYDFEGRRVSAGSTSAASTNGSKSSTETIRDPNGREVPVEEVEENVVSEGPDGKVVERMVRKFDQQGRPAGVEKHRIEIQPGESGASVVRTTVMDSDLNGRFAVRERTTTQIMKSGDVERSETTAEQPDVNGGFEVRERRVAVTTGDDKNSERDLTVYRKGDGGRFEEAAREIRAIKTHGNTVTTTTSQYNTAMSGKMSLAGQTVSRLTKDEAGNERVVTDIFGVPPGRAADSATTELKIRERQVIDRTTGPDQSQVETFSIQRPKTDSDQLGPLVRISETRCTGNCVPPPATATDPAPSGKN